MIIVLIHSEHTFQISFAKDSLNRDSRLVSQPNPLAVSTCALMGQGRVTDMERSKGRNEFITRMAIEDLMKVIPREVGNLEAVARVCKSFRTGMNAAGLGDSSARLPKTDCHFQVASLSTAAWALKAVRVLPPSMTSAEGVGSVG